MVTVCAPGAMLTSTRMDRLGTATRAGGDGLPAAGRSPDDAAERSPATGRRVGAGASGAARDPFGLIGATGLVIAGPFAQAIPWTRCRAGAGTSSGSIDR